MRHAFVAKQAMFPPLMLSFKLTITDKNLSQIGRTFKGAQEMVWQMTTLWGPNILGPCCSSTFSLADLLGRKISRIIQEKHYLVIPLTVK